MVAPDQDLWFPERSPLGKAQTGGAGSAPTMQRTADHQADMLGARPEWWGCAFRGRVRARPAPPDHLQREERSDRKRAVAPDLAWNTSPRRSDQHPSALPHHDAPRPRARRCARPSPPRGRASRQPRPYPARPEVCATPSGWGRGLRAGGQPPLAGRGRYPRPSPPAARVGATPSGWGWGLWAGGQPPPAGRGGYARPSPLWVRGAEYALVNRLASGWRSMSTGCAGDPEAAHVPPPTALKEGRAGMRGLTPRYLGWERCPPAGAGGSGSGKGHCGAGPGPASGYGTPDDEAPRDLVPGRLRG